MQKGGRYGVVKTGGGGYIAVAEIWVGEWWFWDLNRRFEGWGRVDGWDGLWVGSWLIDSDTNRLLRYRPG